MRILLVANTLPPRDISGVGEQVLQLAAGLRERGHEVAVLGRGPGGAPGPKILFPLLVAPSFLRRLRELRPHVVQVHESDGVVVAFLTKVLAAALEPRPRLLALLQVSYVEELKAVRPLSFEGEILGRPGTVELGFRYLKAPMQAMLGIATAWLADLVLAPSRVTAGEIERDYGTSGVGVVPNVTGGLEWDIAGEEESIGEEREGFLLFVGRLRIRKGVEVLLKALSLFERDDLEHRLLIVGDGEHRPALERYAEARQLGGRVEFLGRRAPGEVRALLSTCRALVVPSTYEGMPLVILEAMVRAVPVIASSVSGIPEVVVDGETGWLVRGEDPRQLSKALVDVLADPVEAQRRGEAGRRRVMELFTPSVAARVWESLVVKSFALEPSSDC